MTDNEQYLPIRVLIQVQADLSGAAEPYDRVVGALFAAGVLRGRLDNLTDCQIGELVSEIIIDQLDPLAPESTLCQEAIDRLLRSHAGRFEMMPLDEPCPGCPRCGCPMLFHYGIDEPNYLQCAGSLCRYKEWLGPNSTFLRRVK